MDRNAHPDRWRELWPSLTPAGRVRLVQALRKAHA
jgi:hypothetical protein